MILKKFAIKFFIIVLIYPINLSSKKYDMKPSNDKIQNLLKAYPDFLKEYKYNNIIWNDGTTMNYDDFIENKNFNDLMNNPDLEDQMKMDYPDNNYQNSVKIENNDPGRIRCELFFLKMYGENQKEVEKNLVKIIWMPKSVNKKISVTTINNIHIKLQEISSELDNLPDDLKKYVINSSGSYFWKFINGTKKLSTHSFGIAIDINTEYSNYWMYDLQSSNKISYKNSIPIEIVKIFEKYGFIWGGKWYHYDTMHFEYRPELLMK